MPNKEFVQAQIEQAGTSGFSSKSAEEAVIGKMLLDSGAAKANASKLTAGDFYYTNYGKIFRGIQGVITKNQDVDLITVDAVLNQMFPSEASALSEAMVKCSQTKLNHAVHKIDDYIQIVRDLSTRRKAIASFEGLVSELKDPTKDIGEIIGKIREETSIITGTSHRWENIQDVLLATYEHLEKRQSGEIKSITSGMQNIDKKIGGFFGGELTIIGARPAVGKSAFGANIALGAARAGFKIAIVSREMTDIQYGTRLFAHGTEVDGMKFRTAKIDSDEWGRIAECLGDIGTLPIDFMFTVRTVEDLVNEVTQRVERKELDMLVIDYLQLMETQRQFKQENLRVGYISTTLKHLATDCNIPIIALAQVNRDSDGKMPMLKDLKDSGSIEQDADGVIFLHRPENIKDPYVHKDDTKQIYDRVTNKYIIPFEEINKTGAYLCVYVAKQRQGEIGGTYLNFKPSTMKYSEITRDKEGRG